MTRFIVDSDDSAFGHKVVEGVAFTVKAFQCPRKREAIPHDASKGVYLLLDDRHTLCYVGEAGRGAGGIGSRILNHVNSKETWWSHAVFFVGPFEKDEDLRYWVERRLFELAKPHFAVVSSAPEWKRPVPDKGDETLRNILSLCALLGLPFSRPIGPQKPSREEPYPGKNHNVPHGNWPGLRALAQAIAAEKNEGKGDQGMEQVLKNFWVPSRQKWRKAGPQMRALLESVGVEFDDEGFVKSCAKVPFPLSGKALVQPKLPL